MVIVAEIYTCTATFSPSPASSTWSCCSGGAGAGAGAGVGVAVGVGSAHVCVGVGEGRVGGREWDVVSSIVRCVKVIVVVKKREWEDGGTEVGSVLHCVSDLQRSRKRAPRRRCGCLTNTTSQLASHAQSTE